ncbi:MAG TPA: C10 family peptidase [Anaerohalosphaeraceae bacterium]|nr:C10 family peptidase [Anaerohalosphaeraceae bacterium]
MRTSRVFVLCGIVPFVLILPVFGVPTSVYQARQCASGWLSAEPHPLGMPLSRHIQTVQTVADTDGQPLYHVIQLEPSGFLIVSGDDGLSPVVAFAQTGTFSSSSGCPLAAFLQFDFAERVRTIRRPEHQTHRGIVEAQAQWTRLLEAGAAAEQGIGVLSGQPGISEPRVDILVQSRWGQTTCCSSPALACYNYYTPPLPPVKPDGDPTNYPCGCVATAMAQLMRYHSYPANPVAGTTYNITVDGLPVLNVPIRGGDGAGGPYQWNLMVYQPDCSTSLAERQAIGALTFDAGISVNMSYTAGGSYAFLSTADQSLVNQFCYLNSIWGKNPTLSALVVMLNPNLDYAHPVIVGLQGTKPEHAVVVDGYGYHLGTMYHHINMGWEGLEDAWYNFYADMPAGYTSVFETVFNVFIAQSGEIISGRVMDAYGIPLAGQTVTARKSTGELYQAVTDGRGIYAIANLPSASAYTVSVPNPDYSFSERTVTTGTSVDGASICGNRWGIHFVPFGGTGNLYFVDAGASGRNNGANWTDAFNYLQDALAVAVSGDRILVAEGVYKPDRNTANPSGTGNRNATFQLISGVEIYGGFPAGGTNRWSDRDVRAHETILSGDIGTVGVNTDNSRRVVTGSGVDSTVVLDGFTITLGYAENSGAGILNNSGSPTIRNCLFRSNHADYYGGGASNHTSTARYENCIFTENYANYGGAMWNYGSGSQIWVQDCLFLENTAGVVGAALDNTDGSTAIVIGCRFIRNAAEESGGAVFNISSIIDLINCTFLGNRVTTYYGGAFRNQGGSGQVTNCLFVGNRAANAGSGNGGAVWNYDSNMAYRNCTFADNVAGHFGGGMYNYSTAAAQKDVTIANCIFWGNQDSSGIVKNAQIYDDPTTVPTVLYSCIQDADPDDGSVPYGGTANDNIDDNPLFTRNPNDGGDGWGNSNDDYGDLYLAKGSPCMDTGSSVQTAADTRDLDKDGDVNEPVPFTLDGRSRFADGDCSGSVLADRGAYELAWLYLGDLDGDCDVDLDDFGILAQHWLAGK